MLDTIKLMLGINVNDFDDVIDSLINAAKIDLITIGIADSKVTSTDDYLIKTAIITYVKAHIDIDHAKLYFDSYNLQKDYIRHLTEYTGD